MKKVEWEEDEEEEEEDFEGEGEGEGEGEYENDGGEGEFVDLATVRHRLRQVNCRYYLCNIRGRSID